MFRKLIVVMCLAAPLVARPMDALAALEDAQAALFEEVAPAVVVIENGKALGAGFAVAPGLVLTAAHVVAGASAVAVTLPGGRLVRGEVAERSADGLDLALVRVAETPARTLPLLAHHVRTGAYVASIGHGDGARWTLATGIVANAAADGPDGALLRLQIPLRPGASGGPVVDRAGNVLGVVTHGDAGSVAIAVRADAALRSLAGLAAALRASPAAAGPAPSPPSLSAVPVDVAADAPRPLVGRAAAP